MILTTFLLFTLAFASFLIVLQFKYSALLIYAPELYASSHDGVRRSIFSASVKINRPGLS